MGKLKYDAWVHVGAPDHILEWIKNGTLITFKKEPVICNLLNQVSGAKQCNFIDNQLKKLLHQGAMCECRPGEILHCVLLIKEKWKALPCGGL